MPKMNGIDLYNKISKMDENIRVCFLSDNEQFYEDIKNQLTLSMEADFYFLQKPFSKRKHIFKKYVPSLSQSISSINRQPTFFCNAI